MAESEGDEVSEMLRHTVARTLPAYLGAEDCASLIRALSLTPKTAPAPVATALKSKRKTAFFTSERCEAHRIPSHPESFQRTQVIRTRILADFPTIAAITDIPPVSKEQLLFFHTRKHVEKMESLFRRVQDEFRKPGHNGGSVMIDIDGDTSIMEGTEDAAFVAAGAVCRAIDMVMDDAGEYINAFCGVRPPGHHAEPQNAMGFCLFNNVGIGACHLLHQYPEQIKRVLILDFDVHHGNGTQSKFYNDHPQVCFISTHQGQFYPGTGKASERGSDGNILNVPLTARTASKAYRQHFEQRVLPAMHAFQPNFILISAGFDAHRLDPLADIALETEDYYWITQRTVEVAWLYAHGRIVSTLEGGYNLDALAESAAAHVRALIEGAVPPKPSSAYEPGGVVTDADVDALATAFTSDVTLNPHEELRVTVHYDAKEKLLVLKERSAAALLQQCKNKFNLKKKAKTVSIQDSHGTVVTDTILFTLPNDRHLYLR